MELKVMKFENGPVVGSVLMTIIDGKEWFLAKTTANMLGYSSARKAIHTHVNGKYKQNVYVHEMTICVGSYHSGNIQEVVKVNNNVSLINEAGLYQLIFASKLPKAEEFREWVFEDVLPNLRKNGAYIVTLAEDDERSLLTKANSALQLALEKAQDKVQILTGDISSLETKLLEKEKDIKYIENEKKKLQEDNEKSSKIVRFYIQRDVENHCKENDIPIPTDINKYRRLARKVLDKLGIHNVAVMDYYDN